MTKTIRKFELNEKVDRFTERGSLKKIHVVIQNTKNVKYQLVGLEPMIIMTLMKNMKKNEFALVFDNESKKMLGWISLNEYNIPQRYREPEELYFNDMFDIVQ